MLVTLLRFVIDRSLCMVLLSVRVKSRTSLPRTSVDVITTTTLLPWLMLNSLLTMDWAMLIWSVGYLYMAKLSRNQAWLSVDEAVKPSTSPNRSQTGKQGTKPEADLGTGVQGTKEEC